MVSLQFTIAQEKCTRCGICQKDCPSGIIEIGSSFPVIPPDSEEWCIQCQHCLAVCPVGAISIFGVKPENSLSLSSHLLPTYKQMKTFVRGRRSVRQFREDNVPAELIKELLSDLAHAPTGCNDRDLIFSVVDNRKDTKRLLEKIVSAIEAAAEGDSHLPVHDFILEAASDYRQNETDAFFRGAPHLLVVSAGTKAHCGQEDSVLALAYFELLAQAAGIGTTWCGMLKLAADAVPSIRQLLGLEPDAYFYAMMFGLPAVKYARSVQRDDAAVIRRLG